jgi:hypothetical protein
MQCWGTPLGSRATICAARNIPKNPNRVHGACAGVSKKIARFYSLLVIWRLHLPFR